MKNMLRWSAVVLTTFFVGAQLVRPEKRNPPVEAAQALESHLNVPPEVGEVLGRACMDCHSNETRWPWYSNVAPVSWYVVDHVNHGRKHLNFSNWSGYGPREAEGLLEAICGEAKSGSMPLKSYLVLHPEAKLSAQDIKTVCDWSISEARRLAVRHTNTASVK